MHPEEGFSSSSSTGFPPGARPSIMTDGGPPPLRTLVQPPAPHHAGYHNRPRLWVAATPLDSLSLAGTVSQLLPLRAASTLPPDGHFVRPAPLLPTHLSMMSGSTLGGARRQQQPPL